MARQKFLNAEGVSTLWQAIKSLVSDINTTIEENELVTASALNDLDTRVDSLEEFTSNLIISKTYSELKALRDNNSLVPGQQYRITDYVTTTAQADTQSAGHQFDVIVTADDEYTLNEVARVCLHDGDTYFADYDLNTWQIWYCIDNDSDRFEWADTTNGKGVIYRMIDGQNNDCPYDFKNIQFIRYELNAPETVDTSTWKTQLLTTIQTQFSNNRLSYIWGGFAYDGNRNWGDTKEVYSIPIGNAKAFYTFSSIVDDIVTDHSLIQRYCYDNTIKEYNKAKKQWLNNNVFLNTSIYGRCYSNSFGNECYDNSFGTGCCNNSFGSSCYSNSFGNECYNNSFGNDCDDNSFGDRCESNSFVDKFDTNSFGYSCVSNSFGNSCYRNSFGNNCKYNSFGNGCSSNSFGDGCTYNYFGNECAFNSFVDSSNTSFGNNCKYNSFGNDCYENSFRVSADKTAALMDYIQFNHIDDGCKYNVIWNSATSNMKYLTNINVNRGLQGRWDSYNMININVLDRDYEIEVYKDESGNICIDTFPVPLTTNDIDLLWGKYFNTSGSGSGSASAIADDEIINSVGVGDYDETEQ